MSLVGAVGAEAQGQGLPSVSELNARWVASGGVGGAAPGSADVERLLALAAEDSEVARLLDGAVRRLGVSAPRQLIQTCGPSDWLNGQAGEFVRAPIILASRRLSEPWDPSVLSAHATAWAAEPESFRPGGYAILRYAPERPRLCVAAELTLLDAYAVLTHELAHLARYEPFAHEPERDAIDAAAGAFEYSRRVIERPGGERDAYAAETGAFLRLRARLASRGADVSGLRHPYAAWVNEAGEPRDADAFAGLLLRDVSGRNLRASYPIEVRRRLGEQRTWVAILERRLLPGSRGREGAALRGEIRAARDQVARLEALEASIRTDSSHSVE